jgi:kinetochor protein Mis14/NSL1
MQYINRTFETASSSISINGLDSTSEQFPFPAALTTPTETVEYEAYDTELASRVTALYAQLESLTTGIAQQRRDAPRRAAKEYAAQLKALIQEEVEEEYHPPRWGDKNSAEATSGAGGDAMDVDFAPKEGAHPEWKLETVPRTAEEQERWSSGDIAGVYEDALRTILRLQGEGEVSSEDGTEGHALATTVGKAERAGRAAEVVENM